MKTNGPAPVNSHLRTVLCDCGWRTTCDTARTDNVCACCNQPLAVAPTGRSGPKP